MTVTYEWDVETVVVVETEELEAGEVLDHNHAMSYSQCLVGDSEPPLGCEYHIVLVRDVWPSGPRSRSWAYLENGKLPESFTDSFGRKVAMVPKRFHKEVDEKYQQLQKELAAAQQELLLLKEPKHTSDAMQNAFYSILCESGKPVLVI